jgi:hypothetical protein
MVLFRFFGLRRLLNNRNCGCCWSWLTVLGLASRVVQCGGPLGCASSDRETTRRSRGSGSSSGGGLLLFVFEFLLCLSLLFLELLFPGGLFVTLLFRYSSSFFISFLLSGFFISLLLSSRFFFLLFGLLLGGLILLIGLLLSKGLLFLFLCFLLAVLISLLGSGSSSSLLLLFLCLSLFFRLFLA